VILVNSALLVGCVALGWRMFWDPGRRVSGGLLLALEPFVIAHKARVVHVDALSAGFIAVAVAGRRACSGGWAAVWANLALWRGGERTGPS